jgi:hypothetical protein
MAEREIFINSGDLKLEALLDELPGERGVVATHPHPLYGGEMHNHVVEAVLEAYREKGFSTLRFNFRGVGKSEGTHDEGRGEQEDVASALARMTSLGKRDIDLAGYSFGAWVNARSNEKNQSARRLVMVSPPVGVMDFGFLRSNPRIRLVVTGSRDEIADPVQVERLISGWNPEALLRIIPDADHFYGRKTKELRSAITDFLDLEV